MKKTLKLTLILAALLFTGAAYTPNQSVSAHSEPTKSDQPAQQQPQPASDVIEFHAPKGSSLSLLVRRALQILDAEDNSFTLSNPQIMFAETNIVNQLGQQELEIDEHIKLEKKLLKEFAAKSQELSAVKIAAWQKYADKANFDLSGAIEPIGAQKPAEGQSQNGEPAPSAEQEGLQQNGASKKEPEDKSTANDDIARSWLIGISVLVIAYYLTSNLFDRNKKPAPAKTTTRQRKTSRKR